MADKTFTERVIAVQSQLKAPKNQRNNFGGYNYRNCEDILEAVKPLLKAEGLYLNITDDIVVLGDRYYVKATATLTDGERSLPSQAFAREEASKKEWTEAKLRVRHHPTLENTRSTDCSLSTTLKTRTL